mmetsp:Transcript_8194/g.20303  ORF Transcript_8194/g.20303 Transcript_8194/m.20303 type:complete len:248 (+) Transcript_8194:1139-1882(+)
MDVINANNVHVPLVVLSFPSSLGGFKAPALWNRKPFEGQGDSHFASLQVSLVQDHAGQGWGHFRTKRNMIPLLVNKVVHLIDNLFPCLAFIQLDVLQNWGIVFLKAKEASRFSELFKQPVLNPHFLRVKVTGTAWRVQIGRARYLVCRRLTLRYQAIEFFLNLLLCPSRIIQFLGQTSFHCRAFFLSFLRCYLLFRRWLSFQFGAKGDPLRNMFGCEWGRHADFPSLSLSRKVELSIVSFSVLTSRF